MSVLDRYMKRVAFWLPSRERADVLAELRGVLIEKIEAGSIVRGRPLTEAEVRKILIDFGHPAIVVSRYVERPPIISGGLAYFFWRLLAIAIAGILVAQTLVFALEAAHAQALGPIIEHALRRTSLALLLGFTCVTTSFMIIERRYNLQR